MKYRFILIFLFIVLLLPLSANAGCCQCYPGVFGSGGKENKICVGGANNLNFPDLNSCELFCSGSYSPYTPPEGYPIFSNFCEENTNCPLDKKSCCIKVNTYDEKIESCTSNVTQAQCNVPVTKYIDGKNCEEINCSDGIGKVLSSFLKTEYTPPAEEEKPVEFVPQVTIPGSIEVGGKIFSVNEGQGIIIDGSLLSKYIALLFNWFIGAIGVVTVAYLAFGGMQWLAAAGNASGINKAKETIRDSLIGMLLVAGSYTMLYVINPKLVSFIPLNIEEVKGKELISAEAYKQLTGNLPPGAFGPEMKAAMQKVSQENNIHICVLNTLFSRESGGRAEIIGHDENAKLYNVSARKLFVDLGCIMQSGTKSSGTCSITGSAQNDDEVEKKDGHVISNESGLGLDWKYSHGIGLGQITIFPNGPACNGAPHCTVINGKLYDPRSLLKMDVNLDAVVNLWKKDKCPGSVTQDCFCKYNGGKPCATSNATAKKYGEETFASYNTCLTQNP
jgi:hypothetical protein